MGVQFSGADQVLKFVPDETSPLAVSLLAWFKPTVTAWNDVWSVGDEAQTTVNNNIRVRNTAVLLPGMNPSNANSNTTIATVNTTVVNEWNLRVSRLQDTKFQSILNADLANSGLREDLNPIWTYYYNAAAVGMMSPADVNGSLNGIVGDIALWNIWLSDQDIIDLYGGGTSGVNPTTIQPGNLLIYKEFRDSLNSGNDTAGTVTVYLGTPAVVADHPPVDPPASAGPAPPINPAATADSDTQVTVTWTDNASVTDTYRIERSPDGSTGWAEIVNSIAAGTQTYADTLLTPNTQYFYRIFANDGAADSVPSATVNATTLGAPTDPASLTATFNLGAGEIDLVWVAGDATQTGWEIERKVVGGAYAFFSTEAQGATTKSDATIADDTDYQYRIKAQNTFGYSGWTESNTQLTLPAAPTDLAVNVVVP